MVLPHSRRVLDAWGFVDWDGCERRPDEREALRKLASRIDHTNLSLSATRLDIGRLCEQAHRYRMRAVCVRPEMASEARACLDDWVRTLPDPTGHRVRLASVVDFPDGRASTSTKGEEALQAVSDGADEIDLVASRHWVAEGFAEAVRGSKQPPSWCRYLKHIEAIADDVAVCVKVILEASELRKEGGGVSVQKASELAAEGLYRSLAKRLGGRREQGRARGGRGEFPLRHMLKTSTGVHGKASIEDARALRRAADKVRGHDPARPPLAIKVAGGIRVRADAHAYEAALGPSAVFGTSRGIALLHRDSEGVEATY